MWNPFGKPVCPIDAEMRQWVDGRFRWLGEQLGKDIPRRARVILPTPQFFPDPYAGKQEDAEKIFARVAGYMGVDRGRFSLFIYEGERRPRNTLGLWEGSSAAGLYLRDGGGEVAGARRSAIGIEALQLEDPMSLVATLAHEIGHEILIGEERVSRDQNDHEPLTDLLTVFKGMGIFSANATIRDRAWTSGTLAGWQTKRLGYLDQRTFGYALARFAWTRNESNPPWIKHVRLDVRVALKQGLKFLDDS